MRLDDKALTVVFDVDDDMYDPPTSMENAYLKDSVQFALDPRNDGADMTEFTLGRLADGTAFLYKNRNYTTPVLPDDITRRGLVAAAQVDFAAREGGWRIRARIPLSEVYPLKADATAFGFDFLVNDCDGGKRTFREWTPGIGGAKSAAQFGHLEPVDDLESLK